MLGSLTAIAPWPGGRAYLRVFRELNSLADGRVGVAAVEVRHGRDWWDACRRAMREGEAVRGELEGLVDAGSPLGRLTAAALLARLDKPAGRAAFERLAAIEDGASHASGCCVTVERVGDVARAISNSGLLSDGPPAPGAPALPGGPIIVVGTPVTDAIRHLLLAPAPGSSGEAADLLGEEPGSDGVERAPHVLYVTGVALGVAVVVLFLLYALL